MDRQTEGNSLMDKQTEGNSLMDKQIEGNSLMDKQIEGDSLMDKRIEGKSVMDRQTEGNSLMDKQRAGSSAMEQHPIFKKNPGEWMSLVHKEVCVTCEAGVQHQGWVYTVDPVTESIVLAQFTEGSPSPSNIEIVLGHAVKTISIVNENSELYKEELSNLCKSLSDIPTGLTKDVIKRRQLSLKSWLEKNRLPVTVNGEQTECLTVADVLVIQPPYGPDNCLSTNEIILGKIQGLIKNMPQDHEQW